MAKTKVGELIQQGREENNLSMWWKKLKYY